MLRICETRCPKCGRLLREERSHFRCEQCGIVEACCEGLHNPQENLSALALLKGEKSKPQTSTS